MVLIDCPIIAFCLISYLSFFSHLVFALSHLSIYQNVMSYDISHSPLKKSFSISVHLFCRIIKFCCPLQFIHILDIIRNKYLLSRNIPVLNCRSYTVSSRLIIWKCVSRLASRATMKQSLLDRFLIKFIYRQFLRRTITVLSPIPASFVSFGSNTSVGNHL